MLNTAACQSLVLVQTDRACGLTPVGSHRRSDVALTHPYGSQRCVALCSQSAPRTKLLDKTIVEEGNVEGGVKGVREEKKVDLAHTPRSAYTR